MTSLDGLSHNDSEEKNFYSQDDVETQTCGHAYCTSDLHGMRAANGSKGHESCAPNAKENSRMQVGFKIFAWCKDEIEVKAIKEILESALWHKIFRSHDDLVRTTQPARKFQELD